MPRMATPYPDEAVHWYTELLHFQARGSDDSVATAALSTLRCSSSTGLAGLVGPCFKHITEEVKCQGQTWSSCNETLVLSRSVAAPNTPQRNKANRVSCVLLPRVGKAARYAKHQQIGKTHGGINSMQVQEPRSRSDESGLKDRTALVSKSIEVDCGCRCSRMQATGIGGPYRWNSTLETLRACSGTLSSSDPW